MTPETAIVVAIGIPLVGALAIALAGRIGANVREAVTAITSLSLIAVVWGLLPTLMDGGRPSVEISQVMPGLSIAFTVEPLGMLFAALASGLWLVNSLYARE